jgi:hypothetical protein
MVGVETIIRLRGVRAAQGAAAPRGEASDWKWLAVNLGRAARDDREPALLKVVSSSSDYANTSRTRGRSGRNRSRRSPLDDAEVTAAVGHMLVEMAPMSRAPASTGTARAPGPPGQFYWAGFTHGIPLGSDAFGRVLATRRAR